MTCSLASTVWSTGSQLTTWVLRSAMPGLEHLQEQPLVPPVVASGRRSRSRGSSRSPGPSACICAFMSAMLSRVHFAGGTPFFDRRVLGRQAERVPAHRHQHVHALHAQLARQHVVDGVVAHMAHVQLAARVRQHRAGVELRPRRVFDDAVGVARGPRRLRRSLDLAGVEVGVHGRRAASSASSIDYRKRGASPESGPSRWDAFPSRGCGGRAAAVPMIDASTSIHRQEPSMSDQPSHRVERPPPRRRSRRRCRRPVAIGRGATCRGEHALCSPASTTIASIRRSAWSARSTTACARSGMVDACCHRSGRSGRGAALVHRAPAGRSARRRAVVRARAVRCAVGGGPHASARRCRMATRPLPGVRAARRDGQLRRACAVDRARSPARAGWPQLQARAAVPRRRSGRAAAVASPTTVAQGGEGLMLHLADRAVRSPVAATC